MLKVKKNRPHNYWDEAILIVVCIMIRTLIVAIHDDTVEERRNEKLGWFTSKNVSVPSKLTKRLTFNK